jgi:hypothetical protein
MKNDNVSILVLLFKLLRALTPWEVLTALRTWLVEDCIAHAERTHDTDQLIRWRNLLALLPVSPWEERR